MKFADSGWLSLIFYVLPGMIALWWFARHKNQKSIQSAIGVRLAPYLSSSISTAKLRARLIMQSAAIVLLLIALARPQSGDSKQEVKSQGVEIVFAVDVSESMKAEDVKPSRLEQVKSDLNRLVDQLPGHKIGLVAFAGSASLLSPLTQDPSALKMYIESLNTDVVSSQGTNFESAITAAKEAFERGGVNNENQGGKVSRVIIFLSDGEDHEPGALEAAAKLTQDGVRIFSVAYGTEKGAPIPERDQMGFLKEYKKDRSGQVILTTVKGDELKKLAESGKGAFYFATAGGSFVQNIAEDLSKLEQTEFQSEIMTEYKEQYQFVLLVCFIVLSAELLLGDRRRSFRFWKGRFEVPPA